MTSAIEKNKTAIFALTGNRDILHRLETCKIGVWSAHENCKSGSLFSEALGEFLGRFWLNIDVSGTFAKCFLQSATKSAESCNDNFNFAEKWNPPYDYVISLGSALPSNIGSGLSISASGWDVSVGHGSFTDDPNPVGPYAGAALASSETFKTIFRDSSISENMIPIPPDFKWSAWYGDFNSMESLPELSFDDVHVFGVGAVSHGLFWLLNHWPAKISGKIQLVDPDNYDESNAQRYVGMRKEDIGKSKSKTMALRLRETHASLDATGHTIDMNQYYSTKKDDCKVSLAIAGLDSVEMRKQLALKLPKKIVNMWTWDLHLGSSRFGFEQDWPCLFCAYPEKKKPTPDETSDIYAQTNLPPSRIRELLYSSGGLTQSEASVIAQKFSMDANLLVGKPLRSVIGNICATGKIKLPDSSDTHTVPLVFTSGLAGMAGFVETIRELKNISSIPGEWQMMITKYPTDKSWQPFHKQVDCYLCSDPDLSRIMTLKYN